MSYAEKLRAKFSAAGLSRADADADPLVLFADWLAHAAKAGLAEPNAMVLSTVAADSAPSQRSVLMKGFDQTGFVFFTNYGSRKARQIAANPAVAATFPWYALHRQISIEGVAEKITPDESRDYFHSRPRQAQIGAWASRQSEELASRATLKTRMKEATERFGDGEIPLPEFWGGYRIRPHRIEFWQGRTHRLHDRILYTRSENSAWQITRLSP